MDIPKSEINIRFYFLDGSEPNHIRREGHDYIDKIVTSRAEAIELAHEGVWFRDTFHLIKKFTILPPRRR
jgi:hypothetical protein